MIKIQYRKSLIVIYEKVGELNVAKVQNWNLMAFSGRSSSLNCILPCFKNMNPLTSTSRIFMSLFPRYPDLWQSHSHFYNLPYVIYMASNILYLLFLLLTNIWTNFTDTSVEHNVCYRGMHSIVDICKFCIETWTFKTPAKTAKHDFSKRADSYWHKM